MTTELSDWLKSNGLCFTMAGSTALVFNPPPHRADAHGAAITPKTGEGLRAAKLLRTFGWAVHSATTADAALRWLISLGYGKRGAAEGRPVVRVPRDRAIYGSSKLDLTVVAGHVVKTPAITSRTLAKKLTAPDGEPVHYQAAERAMIAIGWGPEERNAFRSGTIGAPILVTE